MIIKILMYLCLILVNIAGVVWKVALILFFKGVKTSYWCLFLSGNFVG